MSDDATDIVNEVIRLHTLNTELVEALEPFAKAKYRGELTVSDFAMARAAIAAAKAAGMDIISCQDERPK